MYSSFEPHTSPFSRRLQMKLSQQDNSSRSSAKYDIFAMERDEALAELGVLKQKLEVAPKRGDLPQSHTHFALKERREQTIRLEQQCIHLRDAQNELQEMQHHMRV